MHNLLILYNPYYQHDVIEQHVDVLLQHETQKEATVAFGKIRSKLRDYKHPFEETLQRIYDSVDRENPLQLFLTDYASIYVAKVIEVIPGDQEVNAPAYYKEKSLDVENWFIISDIRKIVHDDFTQVRDRILGNFTTPNFGGHHYAVYGNSYVYPLVVEMDEPVNYFEEENEFRFFTEIFKSAQRIESKKQLINYRFGAETFYSLHPNTQDALISAEMEFQENRNDPLYDFTAVVIHLSKAFEKELYLFLRKLFIFLMEKEEKLKSIRYTVQGLDFILDDYRHHKPNIGTNKYLLKNPAIKQALNDHIKSFALKYFIFSSITTNITTIQPVRNEAAHGESTSFHTCETLRNMVVGIGESGALCDFVRFGKLIGK